MSEAEKRIKSLMADNICKLDRLHKAMFYLRLHESDTDRVESVLMHVFQQMHIIHEKVISGLRENGTLPYDILP